MTTLLFVAAGSTLGAPLRYVLDRLIQSQHERVFPWGTWTINISGSFLLGLLTATWNHHGINDSVRIGVVTGLLGAYTTFSTFTWETMRLVEDRAWAAAIMNVAVSISVGTAAAGVGLMLGSLS
ncbi:MAG: fluoride efflux transporter CrcB [Nocardioidaceae bacterium]